MTGQELLSSLFPVLLKIGPNEKTLELYQEIQSSVSGFTIVDNFSQIKRNEKGQGLALEIVFFNEQKVYDIVLAQTTVDYITVLTKNVSMVSIESSYGQTSNAQGQISVVDLLRMLIMYDNNRFLIYNTEVKRFSELNRVKNNLLNLLSK